ncbi:MAG: tetraacyldisaccharide 4'-kinase [Calditrichaeota bacterium]|nr:tetraacyldisaccharide 4'-kinase [Calditrichota bacterium]
MPWLLNILRWPLLPLIIGYQLGLWLRHKLYDWGVLPTFRLPRPVISVGNIQLGGTGKTPLVMALVEYLENQGYRVGVLSRGYRRKGERSDVVLVAGEFRSGIDWKMVGDEPWLIFQRLRKGALGVGRHRYRVGMQLLQQQDVDVFLLDDGLQHRQLFRDGEICLIDVSRWHPWPLLFPFTFLRDLPDALKRVDAVILTRWEGQEKAIERVGQWLAGHTPAPVFRGKIRPVAIRQWPSGKQIDSEVFRAVPWLAFCGIANPNHFRKTLIALGISPEEWFAYPDHHVYRQRDVNRMLEVSHSRGIRHWITTEKDLVRIQEYFTREILESVSIAVLEIRLEVDRFPEFVNWLEGILSRLPREV